MKELLYSLTSAYFGVFLCLIMYLVYNTKGLFSFSENFKFNFENNDFFRFMFLVHLAGLVFSLSLFIIS